MLHTFAAGEYCESIIRQRCACKPTSSDAENSSGPHPTRSIEYVHSVDNCTCCTCARHQHKQASQLACAPTPPPHTPAHAINNFHTCYAPPPSANIASPSFGSDVAAIPSRATLSNAVAHVPTGVSGAEFTCCAAAMATKMQPVKSRARLLMRKMLRWLMMHVQRLLR